MKRLINWLKLQIELLKLEQEEHDLLRDSLMNKNKNYLALAHALNDVEERRKKARRGRAR